MNPLAEILSNSFPIFNKSNVFISELLEVSNLMEVPANTNIIDVNQYIKVIPFLISGLIKIYRVDESGNEIFLYYITSGQSCVMSITTCMENEKSSIKALVEEDSSFIAVPVDKFISLLNKHNLLQSFTYQLFKEKYNELIFAIDNLAFTDTKSRLVQYLKKEAEIKNNKTIQLTHRYIANDLSSSREVISRLLYLLQKEGKDYFEVAFNSSRISTRIFYRNSPFVIQVTLSLFNRL